MTKRINEPLSLWENDIHVKALTRRYPAVAWSERRLICFTETFKHNICLQPETQRVMLAVFIIKRQLQMRKKLFGEKNSDSMMCCFPAPQVSVSSIRVTVYKVTVLSVPSLGTRHHLTALAEVYLWFMCDCRQTYLHNSPIAAQFIFVLY